MIALTLLAAASIVAVNGNGIRLEFDAQLHSRVSAVAAADKGGADIGAVDILLGQFTDSETLSTDRGELRDFAFQARKDQAVSDALGAGHRVTLVGRNSNVEKQVQVSAYERRPNWLFVSVQYRNLGTQPVSIRGYTNHHYEFASASSVAGVSNAGATDAEPAFWSYQSASFEKRPDWLLPVAKGYSRDNYLGMNNSDYGGGTPVLDVWRRDVGLAIGHVELKPKLVSLPLLRRADGTVEMALRAQHHVRLAPGASFETVHSFLAVHRGDHFGTLQAYAAAMKAQGLVIPQSPADAFEPIWCAWGYGRNFTPQQVFETLPVAERLGFRWATLDDGWQVAVGDWRPKPEKFPRGDTDMKALVERIHAAGMKAQLWWSPLAATPASRTFREHPDWLLKNADASNRKITFWNADYLCPAYDPVRQDAAAFVRKALGEWGFDGLKIDGQHLNAAPRCYNHAHAHAAPEDSFEGTPGFFAAVWTAAQTIKPGAVVEICPCGTGYSFFTLPYLNMVVASDPESSWQVRLKGKTLKALAGDRLAFFGDFVELSQGGTDFASTFGVGGVIGTNFAWPQAPGKKDKKLLLTPDREALWKKWTTLYAEKRLPDGEYLGTLYDIGFDRPETHVIRKGGSLYYALYAAHHNGPVQLRGLEARSYRVVDYVHGVDLGLVKGPVAHLDVNFDQSLLIEARPE